MASKWTRHAKRGTLVTPETWEGDRRRTSLNIGEPGSSVVSPDLVLWGDADHGVIVGQDVLPPGAPAQAVAESLRRAIARPASGGRSRQPRRIRVSRTEVAEAIRPVAESLGIQLEMTEKLPLLDDVFRSIEVRFGTPANLGYLDATEAPEPLLSEFFAAAADFRLRCPWRRLGKGEPILLECADWVPGHRLAIVFPGASEARGLALYNSRRDLIELARCLEKDPSLEDAIGRVPGMALLYASTRMFGERRLEEVRRHEWKLASRNAYPVVVGTGSGRESHWPTPGELRTLTVALRVLPAFLRRVVRHREQIDRGGILAETRQVSVWGRVYDVEILFPFSLRGS